MKTMRRIITLALTALMVLALALPAFAEEITTGTIQVTRPANAQGTPSEYAVYQIFDTNPVDGGHTYKLTTDWESFAAPGYFEVNTNGYVVWKKNTVSVTDAAAVAQLAKAYVEAKEEAGTPLTPATTVVAGTAPVEVDTGYYLLMPANGPSGVIMVEAGEAATVEEKTTATGHPTVEKKVREDVTGTYEKFNTADIGQILEFQTIITAGENPENYVLHDMMDEHIKYTNEFVLLRDGNPLEPENNYKIVNNPKNVEGSTWTCDCTFHVEFLPGLMSTLHAGAKIIVQYTGQLKPGALTATEHKNETWVTYANGVPTNVSTTSTETYKITVTKEDEYGNKLTTAGFMLRDNIGKYYTEDENGNISWGPKESATTVRTTNGGVAVFYGLDAENFTLEETIVPDGYTGTTEKPISTKHPTDANKGVDKDITITNVLGETLPETGGVGTTVFYVVGILLIVGALAMLVVFKRRATEQ